MAALSHFFRSIFFPLRRARLSWAMVVVLLAIHGWISWGGGYDRQFGIYELLGLQLDSVRHWKLWQLITYAFIHGSWGHVAVNSICVLLIGAKMEWQLGPKKLLFISLVGIFCGGWMHLLLGVTTCSLLVGFSGGCAALILLLTTISPDSRMFPIPVTARSLGMGILISELLLALIDPRLHVPGFSSIGRQMVAWGLGHWFEMGHACHVGGGLAGWLYGRWLLRPTMTLASLKKERQRREG